MSALEEIKTIKVSSASCEQALHYMRSAGSRGVEGVALWAGRVHGTDFHVVKTVIPEQTALRLPSGLLYVVDDDELHRINVGLYRDGLTLIAQLHSHPAEAYHSDTDDDFPIATAQGSVSIVVPDFARGPLDPNYWAVYRLQPPGWTRLTGHEVTDLILIEDS
jgi:proteasome lid subunit RPN8/RPN11